MDKLDPAIPPRDEEETECDLVRRLARYRLRVEGENRPRSLSLIDRAIETANRKTKSA
jgi:hypothetical protein